MSSEYVNSTTAKYGYGALWKKNSTENPANGTLG